VGHPGAWGVREGGIGKWAGGGGKMWRGSVHRPGLCRLIVRVEIFFTPV